MNACFSHRKTPNHFLIRWNLQHFLWRENCTVFLLDARSCKTSLLAHLQLFREEAELPCQVDAVSFSHVTGKLGMSLGSRRKEFISETEGSWQANSKNSHRVFCRRKFRLSLLGSLGLLLFFLERPVEPQKDTVELMPKQKATVQSPAQRRCPGFQECTQKLLFGDLGFGSLVWQPCVLHQLTVSFLYPNKWFFAFLQLKGDIAREEKTNQTREVCFIWQWVFRACIFLELDS